MNTLFIDSHDELITVALKKGEEIYTLQKESHYEHGVLLMNMIKEIIEGNNLKVNDIKGIVAVNGPGSFTGLRIGLTIAKTMAYSLDIKVYLIDSLVSYLVSSDINENKEAVIEDNKGYYFLAFDKDNNPITDEIYTENIDKYNYKKVDNKLNVRKVIEYAMSKKDTPYHLVRANYVKKIEVEK